MDEGRIKAALEAIKSTMGTEAGEYGIDLFITHHLKELDGSEWKELLGNESPNAQQVFDSLVLSECWDDGLVYDFSLPNELTNYVVSVRFSEDGKIEDISMES